MKKEIIGKKLGMTQIFTPDGQVIPVTVVEAGPCTVVQVKREEKEGYNAVVVAFGKQKEHRLTKPIRGILEKAKAEPCRVLKELNLENAASMEIGAVIKADLFAEKDAVDVQGTTRGRGFSGNIQRWNAQRGKMAHGGGPVHRSVGSTGANSDPSRVFKNKTMPGQYGHETVTIQNLEVVKVDAERNLLLIKGSIPGPKGSLVTVKSAVRAKA